MKSRLKPVAPPPGYAQALAHRAARAVSADEIGGLHGAACVVLGAADAGLHPCALVLKILERPAVQQGDTCLLLHLFVQDGLDEFL